MEDLSDIDLGKSQDTELLDDLGEDFDFDDAELKGL